jgi:hypothetical protein
MRALCFIFILTLLSSLAQAAELESLIRSFGAGSPEITIPYCAPEEFMSPPEELLQNDLEKIGFQKVNCPNPWDDRSFYRQVHSKYCVERFGTTGFTCVESDPAKIKARVENIELMATIKAFTLKRFADYKDSLVTQCCADKTQCRKRFKGVELKIEPGSEVNAEYRSDSLASPDASGNTIAVTEGKLASAYNTENVERVLLVEMAHACQFALISEDTADYATFTNPNTRCDKSSGLLQFKEGLGDKVSQCLIDELEAQMKEIPEDQKKNFCFGKWYREAFSDMKFRSEFKSPYHWTYDMGRRSNYKNYGSVYKYIRCDFPADWKQKMCL